MKHVSIQAEYARIQKADPGQVNLKHMIDRETYFVIGQTIDHNGSYANLPMPVAAYSSNSNPHARVDTMYLAGPGTHLSFILPQMHSQLLAFADTTHDTVFVQPHVTRR